MYKIKGNTIIKRKQRCEIQKEATESEFPGNVACVLCVTFNTLFPCVVYIETEKSL